MQLIFSPTEIEAVNQIIVDGNAHKKPECKQKLCWQDAADIAFMVESLRDIPASVDRESLASRLRQWHQEELIEKINEYLKASKSTRTRLATLDVGGGSYVRTFTGRTRRGAKIFVTFEYLAGSVYLKAMCRVVDRWRNASILCNGQAGTNTEQILLTPTSIELI